MSAARRPSAAMSPVAFYNGRIYVTGGEYEEPRGKTTFWAFESFEPKTNSWQSPGTVSRPPLSAMSCTRWAARFSPMVCQAFSRKWRRTKSIPRRNSRRKLNGGTRCRFIRINTRQERGHSSPRAPSAIVGTRG